VIGLTVSGAAVFDKKKLQRRVVKNSGDRFREQFGLCVGINARGSPGSQVLRVSCDSSANHRLLVLPEKCRQNDVGLVVGCI